MDIREDIDPPKEMLQSRIMLDAMPYPTLQVDRDNQIQYANLACEGFFHASNSHLCGYRLEKFLPYGSPALDLIERARLRCAGIGEYKVDLSSPRIGKGMLVDIHAQPMPDNARNIMVIIQRRAMADKIDRQLTHRGAAKAVTGLAAMLAHEIKNPLSGIRGAAQLLEGSANDEDKNLTQLITQETDRIVKLVDRMEVFSDERSPDRDPINIHSVLDHVRNVALSGFGNGITFVEEYDPSLPPVLANRDQLVQVFVNLIKNACEAVEDVKEPQITMSTAYRPGIKLATPGSSQRVSLPLEFLIIDNGGGVSEAMISHIFDPFVTTKSNGSGLGLALVSKIIGDHGGVIEIESGNRTAKNINPGAVVRILMPAWQGEETATQVEFANGK